MKNAAMPLKTTTTTTSKLRMPQFMALARSESDLPKQVAHASTDCGAAAMINTANSADCRMTFIPSQVTDVFELSQNEFEINHQRDPRQGRTNGVNQIHRFALVFVVGIGPRAEAERQQDRRGDKNHMESLKGHGASARPLRAARVGVTSSCPDCHGSPRRSASSIRRRKRP